MHWALQSIKRGQRNAFLAGMVLTFLMGLAFLCTQAIEYLNVGFNTGSGAFASVFFGLTGLHGAHVAVGLSLLWSSPSAASGGTTRRSTITASSSPGSTGTSST